MFLHPADYGRKAEELLWRKVYYDIIQVIKTNKKVTAEKVLLFCIVLDWFSFCKLSIDLFYFNFQIWAIEM